MIKRDHQDTMRYLRPVRDQLTFNSWKVKSTNVVALLLLPFLLSFVFLFTINSNLLCMVCMGLTLKKKNQVPGLQWHGQEIVCYDVIMRILLHLTTKLISITAWVPEYHSLELTGYCSVRGKWNSKTCLAK